jgi:hypothetical protein
LTLCSAPYQHYQKCFGTHVKEGVKKIFFCDLKPHANFQNPTITPPGRKVTMREKDTRKKHWGRRGRPGNSVGSPYNKLG